MQRDFFRMFQRFRQDMIGETIRGQVVEGIEITVDTIEPYPRVIIGLTLKTPRPDPSLSKEERLVSVVFDDTPRYAYTLPLNPDEAMAILSGEQRIVDADLYLDDECKPQKEHK